MDRCPSARIADHHAAALMATKRVTITWEQGFVFLLRDPRQAAVTFKLFTDVKADGEFHKGSSRAVGEATYAVQQLVDHPKNTDDVELDVEMPGDGSAAAATAKLRARMQLRVLTQDRVLYEEM